MSSELTQRLARQRCLNGEADIHMVSLVKDEDDDEAVGHENEDTNSERENKDNSNQDRLSSKSREETIASLPYCQMCTTNIAIQKCLSCDTSFCYICGSNHVPTTIKTNEEKTLHMNGNSSEKTAYNSPKLSPKYRHPPLPNSQEPLQSQEHTVTTAPKPSSSSKTEDIESIERKNINSGSNTGEKSPLTLSDDISETTSVYSDIQGLGAGVKGISKNSIHIKKHTQIVQKLKLEIASLQEQLHESSYTDIQTLQTRLRTTTLEMQKIRSRNTELKVRVQSLEDRLHTSLQREIVLNDKVEKAMKAAESASNDDNVTTSASNTKIDDQDVTTIKSLKAQLSLSSQSNTGHRSAKEWQRRCLHLERLVKAFEERIKILEADDTKVHEASTTIEQVDMREVVKSEGISATKKDISFDFSNHTPSKGESAFMEINPLAIRQGHTKSPDEKHDVARNVKDFLSRLTPSMREDVESYTDYVVDEKRSIDRQTIRELLEEVKNLTQKVEGIQGFNDFVSGSHMTYNGDPDSDDQIEAAVASDSVDNVSKGDTNELSINDTSKGSGKDKSKAASRALWSFMCGAICMLICVYIEHLRSAYVYSRKRN